MLLVTTVPDADAALKSGADLAIVSKAAAKGTDHATVVRRDPVALVLPFTLSPDDLTSPQLADLMSGIATDWSALGASKRPVRIAASDPTDITLLQDRNGKPAQPGASLRFADQA